METAVPIEVLDPEIVITPWLDTLPPVIRPAVVTVRPTPALPSVASVVDFSATVVLNPLAASTSSDTRARMVLICRQRDCCQNADDRHHDHQFDQGKAPLDTLHPNLLIVVAGVMLR